MVTQPICEPVDLPLGRTALVARVFHAAQSPPVPRLLHFHDVVEIVLFGAARGAFISADASYPVTPGCIVFAPTMHYHDFHFEDGAKDWTLIQIDPYLVDRLIETGDIANLSEAFVAIPDAASSARLRMLGDWIVTVARDDPADVLIEHIIGLILVLISRLPTIGGVGRADRGIQLARFLPAIERLRQAPGARLSLADAATLCHVSPAYFSRRFAEVFGSGFADYVTSYRLHIASRRVATTAIPLSDIGYELGFSSPSHFTARFRERFGVAPRQYRQRRIHKSS